MYILLKVIVLLKLKQKKNKNQTKYNCSSWSTYVQIKILKKLWYSIDAKRVKLHPNKMKSFDQAK